MGFPGPRFARSAVRRPAESSAAFVLGSATAGRSVTRRSPSAPARRRHPRERIVSLASVIALAAGCSQDSPPPDVVVLSARDSSVHMAAEVSGTVKVGESGCLLLASPSSPEDMVLVLPHGSAAASDGVVRAGGLELEIGDSIRGSGGYLAPDAVAGILSEESRDSWPMCEGLSREVAVAERVDEVERAH